MRPFLQSVADGYAARYASLSDFCFVFPGRRSGTFLLNYLKQTADKRVMIAPEVMTISDFIDEASGEFRDNRIDLLLLLFNCYRDVLNQEYGDNHAEIDFNSFSGWGDMVLSDFNDIDTHLADAAEVFKNLKDLNEISADYLTEEQKDVMEQYFGIKSSRSEIERFWNTFSSGDGETGGVRSRFLYLWQTLYPLYERFNKALEAEGISYPGRSARKALERLSVSGRECLRHNKIVFVGFNVLTAVEWKIFSLLKKLTTTVDGREEPLADFVWDMPDGPMSDPLNSASRFVERGIRTFPKPQWLDLTPSDTPGIPASIEVIPSPGNVAQAKIAGMEIAKIHRRSSDPDDAGTAVVLPDESLLLPMINSLPEDVNAVNMTMGISLKQTPAASFVSLLRRLQSRLRGSDGAEVFFYEDVDALLAHQLTHLILGSERVLALKGRLRRRRRVFVSRRTLCREDSDGMLGRIFAAVPQNSDVDTMLSYIDDLLAIAAELNGCSDSRLSGAEPGIDDAGPSKAVNRGLAKLTHIHIDSYRRALERLRQACRRRGVSPDFKKLYQMADRLIASEKVLFEGEPLKGLQIMGLLETRSLDFDHLIIPSMNERIFPRRMHQRSFIPTALRTAFGLPTSQSQESIFAYYFYRLIARAETVTLIYDARSGVPRTGAPSRYILQLQQLYARDRVITTPHFFSLKTETPSGFAVRKDERAIEALRQFTLERDGREFSASSLSKYLACPVLFYYSYLLRLDVEPPVSEFMTPIDLGNVVHRVMMKLYMDTSSDEGGFLMQPAVITKALIDRYVSADDDTVATLVRRAVNKEYLHNGDADAPLSGEPALQADVIADAVRDILLIDREYDRLEILGCEVPMLCRFKVNDSLTVNIRLIVDRIDRVTYPSGASAYRIVDYKTGTVRLSVDSIEEVFAGSSKSKYIFQLLFYSLFARSDYRLKDVEAFELLIYDVVRGKGVRPSIAKVPVTSDNVQLRSGEEEVSLTESFEELLRRKIEEMYNCESDFGQTQDVSVCQYCDFRDICRR